MISFKFFNFELISFNQDKNKYQTANFTDSLFDKLFFITSQIFCSKLSIIWLDDCIIFS